MDAMSVMLKRKIEEHNRLWNRMQEIQRAAEEENRDWTAEERANWDEANKRLNEVEADIDRLERNAKLEEVDYRQVLQAQGPETPEADRAEDRTKAYEEAFGRFLRGGMDYLRPEQRQLMLENRAQSEGTPADGGYLVPPGYRAVMTETMKAFGGLLNHANVIVTATGNGLQWPTNDDTSNKGAILAENSQISEQDATFGTRALGAYTYTSKLVRVSLQLLQDSAFDLNTWLPRKLGERIGRAVAEDLILGDGAAEPEGILENITTSASGTAASGITYDDMINLEHSVDPAYRASGNCRFIFNDKTLAHLRKLKDGDDRPLWLPVPVPGMPATINGNPYTIDQAMPDIPAASGSAVPVIFGDFRAGYVVRQVLDVQMVRLAERYADFLQVGFFGFARLDAVPDDTAAVRGLHMS